jgi:hypothetical protein
MGRRDLDKPVDSPHGEWRYGLGFSNEERPDATPLVAEGKHLNYRRTPQFHGAVGRAVREAAYEARSPLDSQPESVSDHS